MGVELLSTEIPRQSDDVLFRQLSRFTEAAQAQRRWARDAAECVDFDEGRQWSEDDLAKLEEEGRPALTFNKVAPLTRLVMGIERQNKYDLRYMPGNDSASSGATADCITQVVGNINERQHVGWKMSAQFRDGIQSGRGYLDFRMDYTENDFGDLACTLDDPFSCYPDPHNDDYDVNKGNYFITSKWLSLQDIEMYYGVRTKDVVENFRTYAGQGIPVRVSDDEYEDDLAPLRFFAMAGQGDGQFQDWPTGPGQETGAGTYEHYDPARKIIRIIDMQHYVVTPVRALVDLETGDRTIIPDHWDRNKIAQVIQTCQMYGVQLDMMTRRQRRLRWTQSVGPLLIHDEWSPYRTMTKVAYYPYFRRGVTRGMIHDLRDPQREINKRRSSEIEQVTRTAHSGWMYHENSLDPDMKEMLEDYGAAPGINIQWRGPDTSFKPERIQAAASPTAHEKLENKAAEDLKTISGINEATTGELDRVQSGRALQARQKQAVIGLEPYFDNMSFTRQLVGEKELEIVQDHYTSQRLFRITRSDDQGDELLIINQKLTANRVANDITVGKYNVVVDEAPASKTFMDAQFDEAVQLLELGIQLPAEILIEISSLPNKKRILAKMQMLAEQQAMAEAQAAAGGAPPQQQGGKKPGGGNLRVVK